MLNNLTKNQGRFCMLGSALVLGQLALAGACTPLDQCAADGCDSVAGAPGDDDGTGGRGKPEGSGGKTSSGGAASAAGGHASGGKPMGPGGDGSGGMNLGGEPIVEEPDPEPTLEVEIEATGVVRLTQGSTVTLDATIVRGGGFEGPVNLSFRNLPGGTIGSSQLLSADSDEAQLSLIAASDAAMGGPYEVEVSAVSLDGEVVARRKFLLLVAGQPGAIDTSFGSQGLLKVGAKKLVTLQESPKGELFVAANEPATLRQLGSDGAWRDDFSLPRALTETLTALAVDESHIMLGAGDGSAGDPFGVVRLTRAGELVTSFGGQGRLATNRVASLTARPGGNYWLVDEPPPTGYPLAALQGLSATGELEPPAWSVEGWFSPVVEPDDRLWSVVTCYCGRGSGSSLYRFLPDGTPDPTFGVGGRGSITYLSVLRSFDSERLLSFASAYVELRDKAGQPVTTFGTAGRLEFPQDDVVARIPKVLDAVGDGRQVVLLETPFYSTTEEPASVFVFDDRGVARSSFSGDGKLDFNTEAPGLHSPSEQLFPRSVVLDDEFGRAVVAVDIVPVGSTEVSDTALIRVWL